MSNTTLCFQQPGFDSGLPTMRCDRKKGHTGNHSWEEAQTPEPPKDAPHDARLREMAVALSWKLNDVGPDSDISTIEAALAAAEAKGRAAMRAELTAVVAEWRRTMEAERAAISNTAGQHLQELLATSVDTYECCANELDALLRATEEK